MSQADIISGLGVTLILLAFFLLTIRKVSADQLSYLWLNAIGAALACWGSWLILAWPFVILEGVWSLVAIWGLLMKWKN